MAAGALIEQSDRASCLDWIMFLPKAPKHNQSYQDASPSIPFLISKVLELFKRTCGVWGCTRLRLVSHALKLKFPSFQIAAT
jgi:hypothetical protein